MEFKRLYIQKEQDIPTLSVVREELELNDHIRLEYDINSRINTSEKLKGLISSIKSDLNVDISQNDFKELEFYNLHQLFSNNELDDISMLLEQVVKEYFIISNDLVKKFEKKYDRDFNNPDKNYDGFKEKMEQDGYQLSKSWGYRFHGGDICFTNSKNGQTVDINLNYLPHVGVLDFWFFQYFMETTEEFKDLSKKFADNTPKLIQSINHLQKKGILKPVNSVFQEFYGTKMIWDSGE